ncbi:MAG: hypothetical protein Q9164_004730 [Protoblastenia rupestris]
MATAPPRQEWLVVIPDQEGMFDKRMEVRPQHFKELPPKLEDSAPCAYKAGGALLEDPIKEGVDLKINGSFLLATAETKEDVIKTLKEDIYTKSGVWDWNKIQIHPIKSAFIRP